MMWLLHDADGKIIQKMQCSPEAAFASAKDLGLTATATELLNLTSFDCVDPASKAILRAPLQPSEHHIFNWVTKQWEDPRTLQNFKDAQWELIKQARSQAEYAGFLWNGFVFDSDATSQSRITSAVTLAQSNPAFSVAWVLADNSVRTLNQADMLAVGAALGQHVALQFNKGIALREAIKTATNAAQLAAIKWLN